MEGESGPQSTPYDLLGGAAGVRKLAERFYAVMARDESAKTIRAMHASDLSPIVDKLAGFLNGWLGGPRDYFDQPNAPCIMGVHKRYPIGIVERDQWLHCMRLALEECGVSAETRALIEPAFERVADAMRSH